MQTPGLPPPQLHGRSMLGASNIIPKPQPFPSLPFAACQALLLAYSPLVAGWIDRELDRLPSTSQQIFPAKGVFTSK